MLIFKAVEIISVRDLKESISNYDLRAIDNKSVDRSLTIVEKIYWIKG